MSLYMNTYLLLPFTALFLSSDTTIPILLMTLMFWTNFKFLISLRISRDEQDNEKIAIGIDVHEK